MITSISALTKRMHWVTTNERALTAESFAESFADFYFRLHGPPNAIIPGRDSRFAGGS